MKKRNRKLNTKLGVFLLVLSFALLPFSSSVCMAAGGRAAGAGSAGSKTIAGMSKVVFVGVVSAAVLVAIASATSDDSPTVTPTPSH